MILFNATNLILDVQDRIIMPKMGREYPGLEMHHLSVAEKKAIEIGYLGVGKMPATPFVISGLSTRQPVKISDAVRDR